jgi:hypothetical protein
MDNSQAEAVVVDDVDVTLATRSGVARQRKLTDEQELALTPHVH